MPSKSKAQDRFVRAEAAKGAKWAKKWVKDEAGSSLKGKPQHVKRKKGK